MILTLAKDQSHHIDFRLQRILIDGIKEGRIKNSSHPAVISSLIRMNLLSLPKLLSNPDHLDKIVRYDSSIHEALAKN